MAPEQAGLSKLPVSPLSDVYGLGATLYDLLTGRPPVEGGSTTEAIQALTEHAVISPTQLAPAVPRDLEDICLRALAADPRERYASALALAEALDTYRSLRDSPRLRLGRWTWPRRAP